MVDQLHVGEERAQNPDRHRHQEDEVPLDRGQQAAQDEPDEGAGDGHRVVDAEPEPALVGREGVRDDRRGVGEEHGAADALADPHRRSATMAPAVPWSQVTARRMEKTVKTAKPRLKIFTRPNMSPTRPNDTTSTASTTMNPRSIQSR